MFVMSDTAPAATKRFQIARLLCTRSLDDAIRSEIAGTAVLTTPSAGERAYSALCSYAAAALLMPYERFFQDAVQLRYDVELLAHKHKTSFEQTCHRLTTLRRLDAAGVPFAFMRSDPAGYVAKRLALPRLPIPRSGHACPLWVVYSAFQTPEVLVRQLAELPSGDRFLFIARAVTKSQMTFQHHRQAVSIMLAVEAIHADQTVYADGLDFSAPHLATPVGSTCRLCPRDRCRARQEDPVIGF
jgi:predicted transcriptional regulator